MFVQPNQKLPLADSLNMVIVEGRHANIAGVVLCCECAFHPFESNAVFEDFRHVFHVEH